ncbi:MAG: hypothetical protein FWF55_07005 [Treponema sp.]|nr:hypothetical protein [Treponema sp.]
MSVTQTVDIPASHRLVIDVPREVPEGPVVLTFTPAAAQRSEPALKSADEGTSPYPRSDALKRILSRPTPRADALLGVAANLGDITLEQIREERLAKYLE